VKAKKLIKYDFDPSENTIEGAIIVKERIFSDDKEKAVDSKINEYLATKVDVPSLCWDGKVYPYYTVEDCDIN